MSLSCVLIRIPIFPVSNGYALRLISIDPHLVLYLICSNIDFDYCSHCLFNLTLKLNSALWNSIQIQFRPPNPASAHTSDFNPNSIPFGFHTRFPILALLLPLHSISYRLHSVLDQVPNLWLCYLKYSDT